MLVMKNHSESEEFESVTVARRRVIAMSILHGAKTQAQIAAVASSIGNGTYGNDPIILQVLNDYWASE